MPAKRPQGHLVVLVLDLHGRCDRARILDPRGLHCVHGHVLGGALVCASVGSRSLRMFSALVCLIFMVASCSYVGKSILVFVTSSFIDVPWFCASDGLRSLRRCSVLVCLIFTVALVAFACLILVVLVLDLHGRLDRARTLDPRGLRCDQGHLLGWALVCASGGVRSLRRCSALVCLIFMVASCSYLGK